MERMSNQLIDTFVYKHLKLIDIEHNEEINQNKSYQQKLSLPELQNRGICLIKLYKQSMRTGLYGRTIITFGPKWSTQELASNTISSGDIVGVTAGNESLVLVSGVILKVDTKAIDVAFDVDISPINGYEDNHRFNLIKLSNDITHRRLKSALNNVKKKSLSHHLIEVLFGETQITENCCQNKNDIKYFNHKLNDSQKKAIELSLNQKEVAIIHGPPGTGKTTVLIEFIMQCVHNYGLRVLATGPSNVSVDNMVEKLSEQGMGAHIVRLGHPGRSISHLHSYSLDAAIGRSHDYTIVSDMRAEIQQMVAKRNTSFSEIKSLRKELKEREKKVMKQILNESKVVLTTLTTGSPDGYLKLLVDSDGYYPFDVIVIDECSQSIEASAWIVLNCGRKCVLAGDHCQLPPTILSEKAAKDGLEVSLMERLIKHFEDKQIVQMLDIQYRMNEQIMSWSSEQFYSNKLKAYESIKNHTLNDIISDINTAPLVLIDTAGCDMNELDLEDEESKGNEFEADIVSIYVQKLLKQGFSESLIGIISPYNLQVQLIRARLKDYPKVEIKSVDGFQGREKEIIVLSFVRSNDSKEVGFLSERRRINVAVTRAKRHLALICDSDTVSNDSTIKTLIDHFHQNGDIVCAQEFKDEMQNMTQTERPLNLRFKTKESKETIRKNAKKAEKVVLKNKQNFSKEEIKMEKKSMEDELVIEKESQFETKIVEFIANNNSDVLAFPSQLTSFERLLVHKIAESLDLIHESVGEGQDRHIVIRKSLQENTLSAENKTNVCKQNVENEANCGPNTSNGQQKHKTETISVKPKTKSESKSKPINKSHNLKAKIDAMEDEDIDSLIAEVKKSDKLCKYSRCKTSVTILGQKCQFCGQSYCLPHSMPEVHGCGDRIREFLRSNARKDGKLYPGSGVPTKKPLDLHKRNYLEKKLNNKLKDMSSDRKTKKGDKDKSNN